MYAGFWKRVVASIIDLVIIWVIGLLPLHLNFSLHPFDISFSIDFLWWLVYSCCLEASPLQATLGKKILGIKVVDIHGHKISFVRSLGRTISKIYSALLLGIGFFMCLWTKNEQCLHDKVSDCFVVTKDVMPTPEFPPTKSPKIMYFMILLLPMLWLFAYLFLRTANRAMLEKISNEHFRQKPSLESALLDAAFLPSKTNQAHIKEYLKKGADPNQKDSEGTPLLFLATKSYALPLLLDAGADIHALDAQGQTALIYAARNGNDKAVELLLQKGAQVNDSDYKGRTAFMRAVRDGSKASAELLLQKGANINARTLEGETALMFAAEEINSGAVEFLLQNGADANAHTKQGKTPLMYACKKVFFDRHSFNRSKRHEAAYIVAHLLQAGAQANATDEDRITPLMYCSGQVNTEAVNVLLDAGANPTLKDKTGYTAHMYAARIGFGSREEVEEKQQILNALNKAQGYSNLR